MHGSGSAALTRQRGALTGSDTGSAWAAAASHSHNVGVGYNHPVSNLQGTNPNPVGYDWRYPLVQPDKNFIVSANLPSATDPGSVLEGDRITCLTCHNAHASSFKNMTRWDTRTHAALLAGEIDPFTGRPAADDNPAVGCQKCHQMGGTAAYVRRF